MTLKVGDFTDAASIIAWNASARSILLLDTHPLPLSTGRRLSLTAPIPPMQPAHSPRTRAPSLDP